VYGSRNPRNRTEEVTAELIGLDFGVHKSIGYRAKRRAFFDTAHRVGMLVAVVGGSAAFFALIGDRTGVGQIATLIDYSGFGNSEFAGEIRKPLREFVVFTSVLWKGILEAQPRSSPGLALV
jgi:hypothetical protein